MKEYRITNEQMKILSSSISMLGVVSEHPTLPRQIGMAMNQKYEDAHAVFCDIMERPTQETTDNK